MLANYQEIEEEEGDPTASWSPTEMFQRGEEITPFWDEISASERRNVVMMEYGATRPLTHEAVEEIEQASRTYEAERERAEDERARGDWPEGTGSITFDLEDGEYTLDINTWMVTGPDGTLIPYNDFSDARLAEELGESKDTTEAEEGALFEGVWFEDTEHEYTQEYLDSLFDEAEFDTDYDFESEGFWDEVFDAILDFFDDFGFDFGS